MIIKLSPQRRDDSLAVIKSGDMLNINGEDFDFSYMNDGDTLPRAAVNSEWFACDIEKLSGDLVITLLFPNPANYSPEQAFPIDLVWVPDGPVAFPLPLPLPPATLEEPQK